MRKVLLAAVLLLGLSLILSWKAAPAATPILLGVTDDVTGYNAEAGRGERDAVFMAIEEKNAAGGIKGRKIECIFRDNSGDPVKATTIAREFVARGVVAVVGATSSTVAIPTLKVLSEAKIPHLGISSSMDLFEKILGPDGKNYFFQPGSMNSQISAAYLAYGIKKFAGKRVAIFISNVAWPQDVARLQREWIKANPQYGLDVVADIAVDVNKEDLTTEVLRLKAAKPDFTAFTLFAANVKGYVLAIKAVGWSPPPRVVTYWDLWDPGWKTMPKELFHNIHGYGYAHWGRADVAAWLKKFEAKYGYIPLGQAVSEWDGIQTLMTAMEAVGTDGPAIRSWIETKAKGLPCLAGRPGAKLNFTVEVQHSGLAAGDLAWLYINEKGEKVWQD